VHVEAWQDNRARLFAQATAHFLMPTPRGERGRFFVEKSCRAGPGAPDPRARVLRVAVPILLANVTVPILGAVDTGVVGQMGEGRADRRGGRWRDRADGDLLDLRFPAHGNGGSCRAGGRRTGDRDEVAALLTRGSC
jgi:Na+-driven multidrug efflux pump